MPSKSRPKAPEPKTPQKKQVRFNPVAKTESDHVWVSKNKSTPQKAEVKRSSKPSTPKKTPSKERRCSATPVVVAAGLSAVAASLDAKRERARVKTPRRHRERYEHRSKPPATPTTPRRPARREERTHTGRAEKRPKVVYGNHEFLGDADWARVKKRITFVWL